MARIVNLSEYIVLDTETTGLNPVSDRIIEIYAARLSGGFVVADEFYSLIRIDRDLPAVITRLTGIREEELKEKGRPEADVMLEFKKFIRNSTLVGHNIDGFDLPFLGSALARAGGDPFTNPTFDTLKKTKEMFKLYSYSLQNIARSLHIDHEKLHDAKSDVVVTTELFRRILESQD